MLCPKCGFISFDNLLVCGKCKNDLTAVGHELRGTAASVESLLFLGSMLKDAAVLSATAAEGDIALSTVAEGAVGVDEGMTLIVDDEPPALEFDESEIPHIEETASTEVSGVPAAPEELTVEEIVMGEATGAEGAVAVAPAQEVAAVEEEIGPLTVPVAEEAVEDVAEALEIDESALTLDSVEETAPMPSVEDAKSDEETTGQLTLDLEEIDLSDLTAASDAKGKTEVSVPAGAESESEGISFDETMDLSLIIGDEVDALNGERQDASVAGSDLSPVDLTLVDDALVELTVDSSREESASTNKGEKADEVELTMETTET